MAVSAYTSSSDSGSNWSIIGLAFFLAGFVFYGLMYMRYRNSDKRYHYESHTESTTSGMKAGDDFVRSRKGLRNSSMSDANSTSVRGALNTTSGIFDAFGGGSVQKMLGEVLGEDPDRR